MNIDITEIRDIIREAMETQVYRDGTLSLDEEEQDDFSLTLAEDIMCYLDKKNQ
jgi:hypothetical protein